MGRRALTTAEFIAKARAVHGARYDYSKVEYKGAKENVTIICPEHGEFHPQPGNHLQGTGCPMCANAARRPPAPRKWAQERRDRYERQVRIERDNKFPFGGMVALPFWSNGK